MQRTVGNASVQRMLGDRKSSSAAGSLAVTHSQATSDMLNVLKAPSASTPIVQRKNGHKAQIRQAAKAATLGERYAEFALAAASEALTAGPDADVSEELNTARTVLKLIGKQRKHGQAARQAIAMDQPDELSQSGLRVEAEWYRYQAFQVTVAGSMAVAVAMRAAYDGDRQAAEAALQRAKKALKLSRMAASKAHETYADDPTSIKRVAAAGTVDDKVAELAKLVSRAPAQVDTIFSQQEEELEAISDLDDGGDLPQAPPQPDAGQGVPTRGSTAGRISLAILKGLGKGLLYSLIGPFKFLISKGKAGEDGAWMPLLDFGEDLYGRNYESSVLDLFNKAATYTAEFAAIMGWITLVLAIIGLASPAVAAMAAVTGAVAAGAAGFAALLKIILAVTMAIRIRWFPESIRDMNAAKVLLWKDIGGAAGNLTGALTGGFFSAAMGGAFTTEIGDAMSGQAAKEAGQVFAEIAALEGMTAVGETLGSSGSAGAEHQEKKGAVQTVPDPALAHIQREDTDEQAAIEQYKAEFTQELLQQLPSMKEATQNEQKQSKDDKKAFQAESPAMQQATTKTAELKGKAEQTELDPKETLEQAEQAIEGKDPEVEAALSEQQSEAKGDSGAKSEFESIDEELKTAAGRDPATFSEGDTKAAVAKAEQAKGKKPSRFKRLGIWFAKRFGKLKKRGRKLLAKAKGKLLALAQKLPVIGKATRGMESALKLDKAMEGELLGGFDQREAAAGASLAKLDQLEKKVK
ncbi:MAG: hypothetical protein PVH18_13215 [Chloroflexota bacterium]|jgi:hypothetical protein